MFCFSRCADVLVMGEQCSSFTSLICGLQPIQKQHRDSLSSHQDFYQVVEIYTDVWTLKACLCEIFIQEVYFSKTCEAFNISTRTVLLNIILSIQISVSDLIEPFVKPSSPRGPRFIIGPVSHGTQDGFPSFATARCILYQYSPWRFVSWR